MVSVIVIDDEIELVEIISTYLEMYGIDVKGQGYNGYDAVRLYQELSPDFVLLDMHMPNYDGDYAIKKIKKIDPEAKILVMSESIDYSFKEGIVKAVLKKPFDLHELKSLLGVKTLDYLLKNEKL